MRDKLWLFIVVGKAALITTVVVFALAMGALRSRFVVTPNGEEMLAAALALLLTGMPALWMFQTLQARLTRREARAVAISFVVLAPAWLGLAMLSGEISGGYAAMFLGSFFGLAGAFVGVVLMATFVSFMLCLFTLSITRHIVKLESTQF